MGTALQHKPWHKWLVIGICGGVTLAVAVALIIFAVTWYSSRPAQRNSNAVSEVWNEAYEYMMPKEGELSHAGFRLNYALQNNTDQDITIPVNAKILKRLTNGGVLADYSNVAKLNAATFLRAHQRGQLSITIEWGCDKLDSKTGKTLATEDSERCFARAFADSNGLVMFDYANHVEIALSKPVFVKQ
jgi:hypothetical protein